MTKLSHALAKRYVTALLAAADNDPSGIAGLVKPLGKLAAVISDVKDLHALLASPIIPVIAQQQAVAAVLTAMDFSPAIKGFVRVIISNRRGAMLSQFINVALEEINRRQGQMVAEVDVAAPLSAAQTRSLTDLLSRQSGTNVTLNVRVTENVLGGLRVRLGDQMFDDTVAGKLARLHQSLLG